MTSLISAQIHIEQKLLLSLQIEKGGTKRDLVESNDKISMAMLRRVIGMVQVPGPCPSYVLKCFTQRLNDAKKNGES